MKRWDNFVEAHPRGSPFHLSCWLRTIQMTYPFRPFLYVYSEGKDTIAGVFPTFLVRGIFGGHRIISLPFSDYGGPLFMGDESEIEATALLIANSKRRFKCLEVRGPIAQNSGAVCQHYYKRHVLRLNSDPGEIRKRMEKKTIQYSIRKAGKAGIEIIEDNSLHGVEEFYRLNLLTRKKHGVPSQPIKFFRNMFHWMVSSGKAYILLALYDSQVIAAGVFLRGKHTIYYKYNASDPGCLSKLTPNHLLTWHAIEQACLQGYQFLDFGRTSPDNVGLMRYKKNWGAVPEDLPYYFYPDTKGQTIKEENRFLYRTMTSLWRGLPDKVVEICGPRIYRYMA